MEEADRILINSLISIGLEVTDDNMTLEEFSPDILINATSLCLECIFESRNEQQSFPKSCPVNMASRYKVGQALSEAIKSLGYKDAIGYQTFLYPNVKDSRKVISFLIETMPKESGPSVIDQGDESAKIKSLIKQTFGENWKSPWLPFYCHDENRQISPLNLSQKCIFVPFSADKSQLPALSDWFDSFPNISCQLKDFSELLIVAHNYDRRMRIVDKTDRGKVEELIRRMNVVHSEKDAKTGAAPPEARKRTKFVGGKNELKEEKTEKTANDDEFDRSEEEAAETEFNALQSAFDASVASYNRLLDKLDKTTAKYESLKLGERELSAEIAAMGKERAVKDKLAIVLLHGDSSVDKLRAAIAKRESQIEHAQRQWDAHRAECERAIESARSRQLQKCGRSNELSRQLAELRLEMEDCRRDYQRNEGEIRALDDKVKLVIASETVARQSRGDFTKRILELAENKKKQSEEVRRILADIFRLQKEINALRGKLERSFIETSDCITEYARKDEMSRKMHRVLIGIHDNCANLIAVIEERGRLMREIRDIEAVIENENRDDIERNLEKISADYEEAQRSCAQLKRMIKDHKSGKLEAD